MAIVGVCIALLVAGLAAGLRGLRRPFVPPPVDAELTIAEVARRFAWYWALAITGGVLAGITVIGCGGRLAMRLLAVTGGADAQGRITEAEEVVGEVTVDGTIGFVVFNGIFGGVIFGGLYLLVRRYLPGRGWGGIVYGLSLLLVLGTAVEPLRRDNPDFDLVGPGWLSVAVFALLAIGFGVVVAGVMASLSRWLPLVSAKRRVLVRYLGPAVVAIVAFSVTVPLVVVGGVVVVASRWKPLIATIRSPRAVMAGRVLGGILVVTALPRAVPALVDIATR